MKHIQKLRKLILALGIFVGMSMTAYAVETYAATTITCSTSDVGRVLCTDGSIYDTVSEASQENKTAAAMIVYIDMDKCEGLALALNDEGDSKVYGADAVSLAAAHTPSVLGGTWMLASESQWNLMINAWGRETLRDGFSGVGGTNLKNDYYYSSTTSSNQYKCYDFSYGWFFRWNDERGGYARACLKFDVTPVSVIGVTLDKTSAALTVGDTETLTATVSPDGATDKTVTWSTNDANVATVANGVVTAQGIGTATITVTATNGTDDTSDDKQATCTVTVTAEQPVTVTAKADPNNTGAYYATFYDSTTSYTADCEVYYATANADGRLTLQKAEGNVIKAGEGVILKATGENVTLTKTTTEASYDSLLTGSDTETTVENALVLSLGKNGVWFYKYSGTLGANKAYLAQ